MLKIRYLLSCLEDPRYPSIGPQLWLLGLVGLWHPNIESKLARFKQYIFYVTVIFFCAVYIKCLTKFNVESLTLILQYAPFHMGIVKACYFYKDYRNWESVIHYVSSLEREQLSKKDKNYDEIIRQYINHNRRVTYVYYIIGVFSNCFVFSIPYQKNQVNENGTSVYVQIFDGYIPYSQEPPGYYISMAFQTAFGQILTIYVLAWDTFVVTIMMFFAGQLKITRLNCSRLIVKGKVGETHKNVVRCHKLHMQLIEHQQIFNSLISPSMFVYLVVISVNLGLCIIQIAQVQNDLTSLVSSCFFMTACLIQLIFFYWYANEVTFLSESVTYGTFESGWAVTEARLQKEVALLGLATNKKLVFTAGPFNVMSLQTFISILRRSYSLYTLLNKTHN